MRKVTIASTLTLILTLGPVPALLSLSPVSPAGTAPPPASPGYAPQATDFIYPVGAARVAPTTATDSPNGYRIEQTFNNSCDPSLKEGYYSSGQYFCGHTGVDLVNLGSADDVVRASANGLVSEVGYVGAMGEMVRLQHLLPDGTYIYSVYQHMAMGSLRVTRGEVVTVGQPLGRVGATGFAVGAHLHFAIRTTDENGVGYTFGNAALLADYRDPLAYVAAHNADASSATASLSATTTPSPSWIKVAPATTTVKTPSASATPAISPSASARSTTTPPSDATPSATVAGAQTPPSTSGYSDTYAYTYSYTYTDATPVPASATSSPTITSTSSVNGASNGEARGILAAFDRRYRKYVTVTTDQVNVRSGSGYRFAPLTSVVKGARLGYLGVSGDGWVHVALPDDVTGYIARQFVKGAGLPALPPVATVPTLRPPYVSVADARYPARGGPRMRAIAIEPLWTGEKLSYLGTDRRSPSWDKVLLPSGRRGWVLNWYLHGPWGRRAVNVTKTPVAAKTVHVAHAVASGPIVVTTVDQLNLRQGPRLAAAVIERLDIGTRLRLRGYHVSWAAVVAPDGAAGYVLGRYVQPAKD